MEFEGKVVLVTGAGSGIGRAIARAFAMEGAKVAVADVDEKSGGETVEEIESNGGTAFFVKCDVSKAADAEASTGSVVRRFSGLDVLVNDAGIELAGTVVELSEADWDRVIGVNLKGVFLMSKYAVPELAKSHGTIVNIASNAGFASYPRCTAYCSSKGGVVALTRGMALDHARDGIRVNCVCPGAVDTPLHQKYLKALSPLVREAYEKKQLADHPIGRLGRPEDIAEAVLFLASQRSSFVTGAAYIVDGGFLAK